MSVLQLASYTAFGFFVVFVALKMIRIARMPVHLRWDLYPIPRESGSAYGGSYFEEVDWWTKPRQASLIRELRAIAIEILFIQSLFRHNRRLWIFSFPFHLGLYCLVGFGLLLVIGAMAASAAVEITAGSPATFSAGIYYLTIALGSAGWILASLGAIGLLLSRIFRAELRKASLRSDYFNLIFLLAVSVSGFLSWAIVDQEYTHLRGFMQGLVGFQQSPTIPLLVAVQLWITVALLFYFPFTHMTHVFGKYFTYHRVRWEDHPNLRGSRIEKAVTEALGYPLSWAAPHIGKGTWAEAADTEKRGHE